MQRHFVAGAFGIFLLGVSVGHMTASTAPAIATKVDVISAYDVMKNAPRDLKDETSRHAI